MKVKLLLGISFTVAIAALIILIGASKFWLSPALKHVAQNMGSKALGVPLTIDELNFNPLTGMLRISGFSLGNPDTFNQSNAVAQADIEIALNTASLFSRNVMVHSIKVDHPLITYENNVSNNNIRAFIGNVRQYLKKPEPKPAKKHKRSITVHTLEISKGRLKLAHTEDPALDVTLAVEHFTTDISKGHMQFEDLQVSNPSRTAETNLITMTRLDLRLDPERLHTWRFHILEAKAVHPEGLLVTHPETRSISSALQTIKSFSHHAPLNQRPQPKKPEALKRFVIHNIDITEIQLRLLDTANPDTAARSFATAKNFSINRTSGKVAVNDLKITNPKGFSDTNIFEMDDMEFEALPETLFSSHINVQKMMVNKSVMHLEQTELQGNLTSWKKTWSTLRSPPPSIVGPVPEKRPDPSARKHFAINHLILTNCAVTLIFPPSAYGSTKITKGLSAAGKMVTFNMFGLADQSLAAAYVPDNSKAITLLAFDSLTADPPKGLTEIQNVYVGNLKGFSRPKLAQIELIKIETDPATKNTGTRIIKNVLLQSPKVSYERGFRTDNIKAFNEALNQSLTLSAKHAAESGTDEHDDKLIIEHLQVKSGTVYAKISSLPAAHVPIPTLVLKNVGKKQGGANMSYIMSYLGRSFYGSIVSSIMHMPGFVGDALIGVGHTTHNVWDFMTHQNKKDESEEPSEK